MKLVLILPAACPNKTDHALLSSVRVQREKLDRTILFMYLALLYSYRIPEGGGQI